MEIDFSKLNIQHVKEDINLLMFKSNLFTMKDMQLNNEIMEVIKNVKIKINDNNFNSL